MALVGMGVIRFWGASHTVRAWVIGVLIVPGHLRILGIKRCPKEEQRDGQTVDQARHYVPHTMFANSTNNCQTIVRKSSPDVNKIISLTSLQIRTPEPQRFGLTPTR